MKTQASNLLLFTCIMMLFINYCITIAACRKPEIVPAKWELTKYKDEAGNDHYITACPRCQSTWEFHIDVTRINYCPTCALRLEGVESEK